MKLAFFVQLQIYCFLLHFTVEATSQKHDNTIKKITTRKFDRCTNFGIIQLSNDQFFIEARYFGTPAKLTACDVVSCTGCTVKMNEETIDLKLLE